MPGGSQDLPGSLPPVPAAARATPRTADSQSSGHPAPLVQDFNVLPCPVAPALQAYTRHVADAAHIYSIIFRSIHAAQALKEVQTCSKCASRRKLQAARCAARPSKQRSSRSRFASSRTALAGTQQVLGFGFLCRAQRLRRAAAHLCAALSCVSHTALCVCTSTSCEQFSGSYKVLVAITSPRNQDTALLKKLACSSPHIYQQSPCQRSM